MPSEVDEFPDYFNNSETLSLVFEAKKTKI